ncbi:Nn.00g021230.m01.CDS01 [Neocucurbitaria sp. VM-36]
MNTTTPAPQLSLQEVLQIYLLCFDAAVEALPPFALAYAVPCTYANVEVPVWLLWSAYDLDDPPADPFSLSFPPEYVVDGMLKKDMCDWFCWLLEVEVDKKLRELFGAAATWVQCRPRIPFLLANRFGENQLVIPVHSLLFITTQDGKEMVMDGTLQQYGWASDSWLQSWSDFFEARLDTRTEPFCGLASEETKESTEESAEVADGGYWAVAKERMTDLFREIDWEELRSLGVVERLERVKKQADEKFAGANDDACERYDGQ